MQASVPAPYRRHHGMPPDGRSGAALGRPRGAWRYLVDNGDGEWPSSARPNVTEESHGGRPLARGRPAEAVDRLPADSGDPPADMIAHQ